jgi:hypothetical protein
MDENANMKQACKVHSNDDDDDDAHNRPTTLHFTPHFVAF